MAVEATVFARVTIEAPRLTRPIISRLRVAGLRVVLEIALDIVMKIARLRFCVVRFCGRSSGIKRIGRRFVRQFSRGHSVWSIAATAELGNRFAGQNHRNVARGHNWIGGRLVERARRSVLRRRQVATKPAIAAPSTASASAAATARTASPAPLTIAATAAIEASTAVATTAAIFKARAIVMRLIRRRARDDW